MGESGTPHQRFWRRVDLDGPHGCWQWTGKPNRTNGGYGRLRSAGRDVLAHRFAYEMFVGPIPDGLVIDHLCKNTMCVNPDHMEVVTNGENSRRGERHTNGNELKTHCPQGHPYSPENTYVWRNGRSCRTCVRVNKLRRRTAA